ncbi:patatin-like phospholipase family protein [Candidatus Parabeggiatoa sp. HSG14]|uniref:patatin-like phospholipase family protein n=1 Tax=Candidatus Parabeggiatoa sp. HSG14 TaxID=3055593 RepID=UPI0025A90EB0|nr:patatin-like phospholipase family protein [Thiotrichales bacterium HSG14]
MPTDSPDYTRNFADVYIAELNYVKERRDKVNLSSEMIETERNRVFQEKVSLETQSDKKTVHDKISEPSDVRISTDAGLVGLSFSGGGVRSATFNLGILQGLDKKGVLRYCDYLSTVSGGGYIGSCLSSLLTNSKASTNSEISEQGKFPFQFQRDSEADERMGTTQQDECANHCYEELKEVNYLRETKNYLRLDRGLFGLDMWRFVAMFLAGLILINLIPIAVATLTAKGLFLIESPIAIYNCHEVGQETVSRTCSYFEIKRPEYVKDGFNKVETQKSFDKFMENFLVLALYIFIAMMVIRIFAVSFGWTNRTISGLQASLVIVTALLLVTTGLIAFTYYLLLDEYHRVDKQLFTWLNYTLIASLVFFILGRIKTELHLLQRFLNFMLSLSLIAIIPILFAQFLRLLWNYDVLRKPVSEFVKIPSFSQLDPLFSLLSSLPLESLLSYIGSMPASAFLVMVLLIMSFIVNINNISLHTFYRNGLSNTYLIKRENEEIVSNAHLKLSELHEHHNGPYHLINATLNLQGSKNPALSGRGADFFLFSQLYCGAESTGYEQTKHYDGGNTKLATAMAISGAAASPSMGRYTSRLLAFYMILFNVRLNVWMPNPDPKCALKFVPRIWPYYFIKEFIPINREKDKLVNLSDGGHQENLGVYSLLKRRCRLIIATEAGSDPEYKMLDFANLQRKARIDLGINIECDMTPLRPNKYTNTKTHYIKGTIHYPNDKNGTLFFIKTTMTGKEPEDLLAYRRNSPSFPDETTANQFFNEDQFESYRKLGELIGKEVSSEIEEEAKQIFTKDNSW